MIEGYFVTPSGRAFLDATVMLPRMQFSWGVSFVVDTGADRTTVMPADAARISGALFPHGERVTVAGVGGYAQYVAEPGGVLLYESDGRIRLFSLELLIADPVPAYTNIPSFIGRDVLSRCRILYDPTQSRLLAKAVLPDATIGNSNH